MSFIKSTADFSEYELTLNKLEEKLNITIDKTKKIVLIFSIKSCMPCKHLTDILDEVYNNYNTFDLPLIIKFNLDDDLLNDLDTQYIKKFPTILIFDRNNLDTYNKNDLLVKECFKENSNNKGTIMIGNINNFIDMNIGEIEF